MNVTVDAFPNEPPTQAEETEPRASPCLVSPKSVYYWAAVNFTIFTAALICIGVAHAAIQDIPARSEGPRPVLGDALIVPPLPSSVCPAGYSPAVKSIPMHSPGACICPAGSTADSFSKPCTLHQVYGRCTNIPAWDFDFQLLFAGPNVACFKFGEPLAVVTRVGNHFNITSTMGLAVERHCPLGTRLCNNIPELCFPTGSVCPRSYTNQPGVMGTAFQHSPVVACASGWQEGFYPWLSQGFEHMTRVSLKSDPRIPQDFTCDPEDAICNHFISNTPLHDVRAEAIARLGCDVYAGIKFQDSQASLRAWKPLVGLNADFTLDVKGPVPIIITAFAYAAVYGFVLWWVDNRQEVFVCMSVSLMSVFGFVLAGLLGPFYNLVDHFGLIRDVFPRIHAALVGAEVLYRMCLILMLVMFFIVTRKYFPPIFQSRRSVQ